MYKLIFTLIISLSCVLGCKTTVDIPPLDNSTVAPSFFQEILPHSDPFPAVGCFRNADNSLIGSGVLIEKNIVLTAGHVVDNPPAFFVISNKYYLLKEIIIHEEYNEHLIWNDIAVVVLGSDVEGVVPAILTSEYDMLHKGKYLITVGFSKDIKKYSKVGVFFYYGTLMGEPNYIKFLTLKDTIWFGDSGGAVYSIFGNEFKLVGIISTLSTDHDGMVYENSATKVKQYLPWIRSAIKGKGGE